MSARSLICRLTLASPDEMTALGARLAPLLTAGDCIGLVGGLGAGKSTLARAIITTALEQLGLNAGDIPSPTFTLVQPYPLPSAEDQGREIWHFDLWRLEDPEEIIELGMEEALERHVSLIEWPERMGQMMPRSALMITIDFGATAQDRSVSVHGNETWQKRCHDAGIHPFG